MTLRETAARLLRIDAPRACEQAVAAIRSLMGPDSPGGAFVGLSGGLDSSVLAALAVRALGTERVHAACLRDGFTPADVVTGARRVADWLGLRLEVREMDGPAGPPPRYNRILVGILKCSGLLNRHVLARGFHLLTRETWFLAGLHGGVWPGRPVTNFLYRTVAARFHAAFNGRYLHRGHLLGERAREHRARFIGSMNRSERQVGLFIPESIDDFRVRPLRGLYKTQVRQVAAHLGVPEEVLATAPSPEMSKGMTDETQLGAPYEVIDLVLDATDRGAADAEVRALGIRGDQVRLVRRLNRLSAWKRVRDRFPLPVDGAVGGGLRVPGPAESGRRRQELVDVDRPAAS